MPGSLPGYPRVVKLARRAPWYAVPLGIFLLTRLVDVALIMLVARDQIPASALPPHMPMPTLVDPSSYLHVIANWDGQWYRQIAAHGYPAHVPVVDGVLQQNAWAFYPVYPALVRFMMFTGASFGLSASIVSLSCGAAAVCLLHSMLLRRCGQFVAALTVLAVCCAPAAPIFQAAYTESLALFLVLLALWALEGRRYVVLTVAGVALALTRPIAPALLVVVLAFALMRWRGRDSQPWADGERRGLVGAAAVIAVATLVWPVTTAVVLGSTDAYFQTQRAWATVAGNPPDTWLQSLAHGAPPVRWIVVLVVLGTLTTLAVKARGWPLPMRIWTVSYPLLILAVTPPTASVIRFSTLAGAAWWPAPGTGARVTSPPRRAAILGLVIVIGFLLQWWWLRTYFVIDPYSRGHP
jgi:hypothetical protein